MEPNTFEAANATCPSKAFSNAKKPPAIRVLRGFHLGVEVWMAPERALCEHDKAACQDIRALDRDADRRNLIGRLQIIAGSVADALAGVNVQGGIERGAHALRALIFHQA